MGLFYNPIPPHIGAKQPLEPRKLTPPSGPAPPQFPFPADRMAAATAVAWAAVAATAYYAYVPQRKLVPQAPIVDTYVPPSDRIRAALTAWQIPAQRPIVAINLDPPISAPQDPPIKGARFATEITNSWLPRPHIPQPNFVGDDHAPWSSAIVVPYLPTGTRVPAAVLTAWLPPVPRPIVAINLDPPISGPTPDNPPFMGGAHVPEQVLIAWRPPPPRPITAINLDPPISGPFTGYLPIGTTVPTAVRVSWLPRPPDPIVARNLDPPIAGPAPQAPPRIGARTPVAVQVSWLPKPPQPPVVRNGAIETPAVTGVLAATEQADTAQVIVDVRSDAPGILNFGRRVTINRW